MYACMYAHTKVNNNNNKRKQKQKLRKTKDLRHKTQFTSRYFNCMDECVPLENNVHNTATVCTRFIMDFFFFFFVSLNNNS